jgi:hypothetical protein
LAYARVENHSSPQLVVFVEVTHLEPGTFDALTVDEDAATALDALRTWTLGIGRSFAVERGPRDQLRISVVLEPDADGQDAPSLTRHTDATV